MGGIKIVIKVNEDFIFLFLLILIKKIELNIIKDKLFIFASHLYKINKFELMKTKCMMKFFLFLKYL